MAKNGNGPSQVIAHAPCRVDLAGGTLDIWPLYLFHPGAVTVNFAVNVLTRCQITRTPGKRIVLKSIDTRREDTFANFDELCSAKKAKHGLAAALVRYFAPEGGFTLETNSESPAGAGISGSSALMIATTAALARYTGRELSLEQTRVIAQNVEAQLIKVPTGCQDYYPALYGGVSAIHLEPDGIHREVVTVAPEEIDRRFLLVYTGAPRQSGINNWEVFKKHINGDTRVFRNFAEITRISGEMRQALAAGAWNDIVKLLRQEWKLRKTNAPRISTPPMDRLITAAMRNGARAAKVCGAGGGGCIVFFIEADARERLGRVVQEHRGRVLPFQVARDGLTVNAS